MKKNISSILKYHNYAYFPSDFEDRNGFYYLYSNHYHTLANLFMKERKKKFEKVTSQTANCHLKMIQLKKFLGISFFCDFNCCQCCFQKIISSILKYHNDWCSSLKKIAIPSSVTKIDDYAFRECSSLKEITIPSSVTSIGCCAFCRCSSLTHITLPKVKEIWDKAFCECKNLEIIDASHAEQIRTYAFYGCSSLKQISLPNVIGIGRYSFGGCSLFEQISLENMLSCIDIVSDGC